VRHRKRGPPQHLPAQLRPVGVVQQGWKDRLRFALSFNNTNNFNAVVAGSSTDAAPLDDDGDSRVHLYQVQSEHDKKRHHSRPTDKTTRLRTRFGTRSWVQPTSQMTIRTPRPTPVRRPTFQDQ